MKAVWVVGGGGLLGSAVRRCLARGEPIVLFTPGARLEWQSAEVLHQQIRSAVRAFETLVRTATGWEVYWAAGRGTMRSQRADLELETRAIELLVEQISRSQVLRDKAGAFIFASSAGAIYAGAGPAPISESDPVCPTTPYGHCKLEQEDCIRSGLDAATNVRILLARISTVYGVGQSVGKPQGLISHIAKSLLTNRPVHVFVPLDTIRDYIAVDDAATEIIRKGRENVACGEVAVRIVAAEWPTTISEIVSIFRRLTRRSALIFTSAEPVGNLYPRCVQFRSLWPPAHPFACRISLANGISDLLSQERLNFMRGRG